MLGNLNGLLRARRRALGCRSDGATRPAPLTGTPLRRSIGVACIGLYGALLSPLSISSAATPPVPGKGIAALLALATFLISVLVTVALLLRASPRPRGWQFALGSL